MYNFYITKIKITPIYLNLQQTPPFLTIRGKKELLQRDSIAIVGSRNASTNGLNFTHKIVKELSQADLVIVSGLARGIDTAAHKSSIVNGTIAVIAGA